MWVWTSAKQGRTTPPRRSMHGGPGASGGRAVARATRAMRPSLTSMSTCTRASTSPAAETRRCRPAPRGGARGVPSGPGMAGARQHSGTKALCSREWGPGGTNQGVRWVGIVGVSGAVRGGDTAGRPGWRPPPPSDSARRLRRAQGGAEGTGRGHGGWQVCGVWPGSGSVMPAQKPAPLLACGAVCGAGPRVRVRQRAPHHPKGRRPPSGPAAAAMAPPRPRTVRAVRASALGALLLLASTASTAPAPHPHPPLSPHGAALADLARAAAHAAVDALSRDGAAYDLEAVHTGTLEAGGRGLGWL